MIFKDVLRFYVLTSFENLRIWVEDSRSLNITKHSERNRQLNFFRLVSVIGNLFLIFFIIREWIAKMTRRLTVRIDFLNREPRFIGQLILIRGHAFRAKQLHSCISPPLLDELSLWKLSQIVTENWLHESKKLYFLVRRITTLGRGKLHETNCTKLREITLTLVYTCRFEKFIKFQRRFTDVYSNLQIYIYKHQKYQLNRYFDGSIAVLNSFTSGYFWSV